LLTCKFIIALDREQKGLSYQVQLKAALDLVNEARVPDWYRETR